jgi:outer membrane protein
MLNAKAAKRAKTSDEMNADTPSAALVGTLLVVLEAIFVSAISLSAQPTPTLRVTFADAIRFAIERNPTVQGAAAAILHAEGQLRQARAATLLQLNGNVTTTTLNTGVEFQGTTVTPRHQVTATLTADMPIVAAAAWARRTQAEDTRNVAERSLAETQRQVAFATADAYLSILAARRVVEGNVVARDVAKAHFDLAAELEQRGAGSRLNALRAQQQWSANEGLLEAAQLALYRAQESLGALIAADEPADAIDEPALDLPSDAVVTPDRPALQMLRSDLMLFTAQEQAADRIVRDSSKDWWPSVDAVFQPSTVYPSQFFLPSRSWRFLLQGNIPIFDAGQRAGTKMERQASLDQASATLANATIQASSEVRAAREAVASGERILISARAAAEQAHQVVDITNISFRAGAVTNIEVIDAERTARDTDTAVAIAEDRLRRAKLELLNAIGRFP